ncbi:MAG TPA: hypothetical protein VF331_01215 [Polyangiales bacterium]
MNLGLPLVVSLLACSSLAACTPKIPCKPGATRVCLCPPETLTTQVCQADKVWAPCRCGGSATTPDAATTHDTGTPLPATSDSGPNPATNDASTAAKDSAVMQTGDSAMSHTQDGAVHGDAGSSLAAGMYAGACTNSVCATNETCQKTMSGLPATNFSYCAATCTATTDCAMPSGGTAMRSCNLLTHICELSCPLGTTCPSGMVCNTPPLAVGVCTWPG